MKKKSWLVTPKRNVPSLDPKVFVSPPSPLVSNASSINATPTSMLSFFRSIVGAVLGTPHIA